MGAVAAMSRGGRAVEVDGDFEDHFARNSGHHLDPVLTADAVRDFENWPRILKTLGGIRKLTDLPGMVFIVDTKKEQNAVNEARRLGIPIVGVVDSNADPDEVDYPVPGNDDAMRAIGLFAKIVADACIEGRARYSEGRDMSTGDEPVADAAGSQSVA